MLSRDRQATPAPQALLSWLERSGLVESRHYGTVAVVDPDGKLHASAGDIRQAVYGRSALKLLQAIATLRSGARLTGMHLAIAAASHEGTSAHQLLVHELLGLAGVGEDALRCPVGWPADFESRQRASAPSRIAMCCSGKHASFLLACQVNGWSTADYLQPHHPLQQSVRAVVEELCGEPIAHVGIDGCGAPVYATSFIGLANGLARTASSEEGRMVRRAIQDHPWIVDSPDVARAINELGVVAKRGAEGICVVSAPDGLTALVKIADGSARPALQVAVLALASAGGLDLSSAERFAASTAEPVLGGDAQVGSLHFAGLPVMARA